MDITTVLTALISLIGTILTVVVAPLIKAKVDREKLEKAMAWIRIAASAAEQIYDGPGRGEEKKQYVLDFLASMGLKLDAEAVNAMIEAQVHDIKGALAE